MTTMRDEIESTRVESVAGESHCPDRSSRQSGLLVAPGGHVDARTCGARQTVPRTIAFFL